MSTFDTVMGFLKSLPPNILKPHGEGPIRFTVSAIEGSGRHTCQKPEKKKERQSENKTQCEQYVGPKHVCG